MPCDYRILQSPTKGQVKLVLLETAQRSPYTFQENSKIQSLKKAPTHRLQNLYVRAKLLDLNNLLYSL